MKLDRFRGTLYIENGKAFFRSKAMRIMKRFQDLATGMPRQYLFEAVAVRCRSMRHRKIAVLLSLVIGVVFARPVVKRAAVACSEVKP